MNLNDKRKLKAQLYADAKKLNDTATSENRDLTAEELEQFSAKTAEIEKLDQQIARLDKLDSVESSLKQSAGRISQPQELAPIHNELHRYSVVKAMRDFVQFGQVRGLEKEVSDEVANRAGKTPNGFFMPMEKYGNLDLSTGAGAIQTNTDINNFIELLRSKMLAQTLGATVLNDLSGLVQIPRQSGGATAQWLATNGSNTVTGSNQSIDYVPLSPKTVATSTTYTRQFLKQTSLDVENFVTNDLATVLALELDRVGFGGSGSGAVPEGILYNSDITTVSVGTDGGAPTFAKMVEMETSVAAGNADLGKLAYVTTPQVRGKCKVVPIAANTAEMIWARDNTVNAYSAYATNQLPHNLTKGSYGTALSAAIFGNWADLLYGIWGGLDIVVNPYTGDLAGSVRITLMQDADVGVRHPESFAKVLDFVTT